MGLKIWLSRPRETPSPLLRPDALVRLPQSTSCAVAGGGSGMLVSRRWFGGPVFGVLRSHRFPLVAVFRLQLSCLRIPSPSSGIYSVVILQLTCIKCGQKQHFVASCRLCPFHQHRLFWPGSTPLFKVTDSSSVICLLRARSLDGVIVAPENECENSQSCVSVLFCVFFFFYQDRQASYLCCSLTFFAWKTFAVLSHSFLPG